MGERAGWLDAAAGYKFRRGRGIVVLFEIGEGEVRMQAGNLCVCVEHALVDAGGLDKTRLAYQRFSVERFGVGRIVMLLRYCARVDLYLIEIGDAEREPRG